MENSEYLKTLLAQLKKPIPCTWRVQSYSKNKPSATVMAYIDARDAMDVLDAYCVFGWHREHYLVENKVYCRVGIVMPDGSVMWRSDCGTESNQDAEKGQASDSFKRACVNFGIGRFLYDLPIQYLPTNVKKEGNNYPHCIDEQGKQIWDLTTYINNKNPNAPNAPKAPITPPEPPKPVQLPILIKGTDKWNKIVEGLADGLATIEKVRLKNDVSAELEKELNKAVQDLQAQRVLNK